MGGGNIRIETLVLYLIHCVNAVGKQLVFNICEVVTNHYGFELHSKLGGKFAPFGEKFKAYVGHFAVLKLAIYYEIVIVGHC